MSLRHLVLASLALLVTSSRAGHADRFQLGFGLESGDRSETSWFGGVVELDARLTRYLSARIAARAQHFAQTTDTCDFDSKGPDLDATGGLRVDFIPLDRVSDARPYVAGGIGEAWDRVLGARHPAVTAETFRGLARWIGHVPGQARRARARHCGPGTRYRRIGDIHEQLG
jgi:hypothetical protein